jgi:flagellar hook-length control protein FliK
MREAMAQALEDGKRRERTDPVADTRGSRRSEQSQALMLDSVREKVGEPFPGAGLNRENAHAGLHQKNADAGRNRENTDTGRDRENADAQPEGKLRAERILALSPEKKAESVPSAEKPLGDAPDRLLQRIDTNGAAVSQGNRDSGAPQQTSAQDLNSLNRNVRQEIFSQVENGFLQNRQDGSHQLILKLNPQDLGQITLILSVKQGEVKALLRAEHGETATVLTEQLAELKASLEAQGLKVKELDVQTQLQNNEFAGQWNGAREHNLMQDAQERARMIRLSLLRRDTGGSPATPVTEQREQTGLHIVA